MVEPPKELRPTQRRQLDDEVELIGAVMEAIRTLTIGTVTVGPHARARIALDEDGSPAYETVMVPVIWGWYSQCQPIPRSGRAPD